MGRRVPASNRHAIHMPNEKFGHKPRLISALHREHFSARINDRPANGIFLFVFGKREAASRPNSKPGEPGTEAWINAEINQQNIDSVLDSVGDDWGQKISVRREINRGQNRAVDNVLDNSG